MIGNGIIKINGVVLPYPNNDLNFKRQQFVDSTRNALGKVVAQKINRRILKIDSLQWDFLTASVWRSIQVEIEKLEGDMEIWDNLSGAFVTLKVYWGDEEATPHKANMETGEILEYVNCKCNIIDMGY